MVVFNDNMLILIPFDIFSVDLGTGVLALSEGANIKIVVKDGLHGGNGPCRFDFSVVFIAFCFRAELLRHTRCRNAAVCQIVGDFLISPAVVVAFINPADDIRFHRNDLKFVLFVDDIAIGRCTDPLSVLLSAPDDVAHLFGGIGDGDFVDEELKLDLEPVIIIGKVDAVTDGDDPYSGITQVFQLPETAAVAARETGKVFYDQNVIFVGHQTHSHFLIAFTLIKGIAGAVTVLIKGK